MKKMKFKKITDVATSAVMLAIVFGFALAFWIVPDKATSYDENRDLAQLPSANKLLERIADGRFSKEVADYYRDQLPLRDEFIALKASMEAALLKSENNAVILAQDGYLVSRPQNSDKGGLYTNVSAINRFCEAMNDLGMPSYSAVAPRSCDVLTSYLPKSYSSERDLLIWDVLSDNTSDSITKIDLLTPLSEKADGGEAVYYRTDHHWTTLGAYYAYLEIADAMGIVPYDIADFDIVSASDDFYGTTWSKSGFRYVKGESIEYFRYTGDEDFITSIPDADISFRGFYDTSYLETKDKYGSFLSGNNSLVEIKYAPEGAYEADAERPDLLLIKDSFAHSVVPFLARHFDIDIIDARYCNFSVYEYALGKEYDAVLFLNGIDSLTDGEAYKILTAGLPK